MKKIIDITKGFLVTLVLLASMVSCSEDVMDKINEDVNHTKSVEAIKERYFNRFQEVIEQDI